MSAEEAKGEDSKVIGVVASDGDAKSRSGMATGKFWVRCSREISKSC